MKFYAIKQNYLYQRTFKTGARKSSRTVTVFVLKDKYAAALEKQNPLKKPLNRIGISVSKKVGDAVHRNRAKRVIREAYRQIDKSFEVKKGYLIVIVPKTECTVRKEGDVYRDMLYCFSSLDMLCGKNTVADTGNVRPSKNISADDNSSPRSDIK